MAGLFESAESDGRARSLPPAILVVSWTSFSPHLIITESLLRIGFDRGAAGGHATREKRRQGRCRPIGLDLVDDGFRDSALDGRHQMDVGLLGDGQRELLAAGRRSLDALLLLGAGSRW